MLSKNVNRATFCLLFLCIFSYAFASDPFPVLEKSFEANPGKIRSMHNANPGKFRSMHNALPNSSCDFLGISELTASGSGQYSEENVRNLIQVLPSNAKIIFIDLREESHGFINGKPISWRFKKTNDINIAKSILEIEEDEKTRLNNIFQQKQIHLKKFKEWPEVTLEVNSARTEREFIESLGYTYIRLPVTDNHGPSDEIVDLFVKTVVSLPKDSWFHFHCKGGNGRTTTFLTLYDMMFNANKVSFDDILQRQIEMGGICFTRLNPFDLSYFISLDRLITIEDFYQYCREVPNFSTSWIEWKKQKS